MSTPVFRGFLMSIDNRSATPAEAPAVKNMLSGSEGCPSRAVIETREAISHSYQKRVEGMFSLNKKARKVIIDVA